MMLNNANSKIRTAILRLFLFFVSIFFVLLCAESILRIAGFSYRLTLEKVRLGQPNPVDIYSMYAFDEDLFWVPKDYYGSPMDYHEKLAWVSRMHQAIVYIGDSCTEYGIFPHHVQKVIFLQHPDKDASFVSFGVGAWTSYQGLELLKRDLIKLRPKILVIFFGWNDHTIGFGIEDKEIGLINHSFPAGLQRFRAAQLIIKTKVAALQAKKLANRMRVRVSPEDFRSNLKEMVNLARDNGIMPVLLTGPTSHESGREPILEGTIRREDMIPYHQKYVSIIRGVAAGEKVVLCDIAGEFESLPKEDIKNIYMKKDGLHPTYEGDKKIAEFLYQCLERNNLLAALKR